MAITNAASLRKALTSGAARQDVSFAPSSGYRSWALQSHWGDFGGATPTAMAACDNTTVGAIPLPTAGPGTSLYLAGIDLAGGAYSGQTVAPLDRFVLVDRLAASGACVGNTTNAQSIAAVALSRGVLADYSNLVWFLEWYGTSSGTAVTWTWTYTDSNDNAGLTFTTANTTSTAGRAIQFLRNPPGRYIKAITQVQLSASTGSSANFGVTAAVLLGGSAQRDNFRSSANWQQTALMPVDPAACPQLIHFGQYHGGGFGGRILIAKG